jgi:hypothetical protein
MTKMKSGPAILAITATAVVSAAILLSMGRPPICTCGQVLLWYGDINGPGNSQHIADWYSPTHVVHGLLFFLLLYPLRRWVGNPGRAVIATALEATWEVVENTPWVIARYRSETIGIGYVGDSVLNSMSDIAFMLLGFLIGVRFGWRVALAAAVALEIAMALIIRDNVALNLLMLIYPVPGVRAWQAAGQ